MKFFNGGASRPANHHARLSAAQNLVQRTLAQHGLLPASGTAPDTAMSKTHLFNRWQEQAGGASSAPKKSDDLPSGAKLKQDTFNCHAGTRAFQTYVPASAQDGVTGVIVMLHGCTQTPEDFAAGTDMNALAELHRFAVVYPAQSRGDNAQSCWNWFSRGDQQRGRGEPAILAGITKQVCAEHGVTRENTFVAGLSAGAAMSAILGETYADVFAAVGAHSGLPAGAAKDVSSAFMAMGGTVANTSLPPQTTEMVRTIVFHGTADATVQHSNSDLIAQRALRANAAQSVEASHTGKTKGRSFVRKVSENTRGVPIVEQWSVEGQGHAWSGGNTSGSYADPTGPDASAEMVRFFFTPTKD